MTRAPSEVPAVPPEARLFAEAAYLVAGERNELLFQGGGTITVARHLAPVEEALERGDGVSRRILVDLQLRDRTAAPVAAGTRK
jgi:hypothetical protein